jgi:hypothetical protein
MSFQKFVFFNISISVLFGGLLFGVQNTHFLWRNIFLKIEDGGSN